MLTVLHDDDALQNLRGIDSMKLLVTLVVLLLATSASAVDDIIWRFHLNDGHPANCKLGFTRVTKDDKGQPNLEADSRRDETPWHSCITVPSGLLKAGEDYLITLDYEIIERSGEDSYFYVFARSHRLGNGADRWQRWRGEPGARGVAQLRISPTADDVQIVAGIHNQGAMRIRAMKIVHGTGWTTIPLDSASGDVAPPAPPTGAQPFKVEGPVNKNGPILNLSDFGAVADGDSPPSSGPDRNLQALNTAIAKCREVRASKLTVPKGVYRIPSGETIKFEELSDFIFDGGGSTFVFDQIKGGHGISIKKCNRTVFSNFNLDWDWKKDPLASIGRVTSVAPDSSFFEMHFETRAPLDPKRWVTMNPLDEKLRAPGTGTEFSGLAPRKIEMLDTKTVRVWPARPMAPIVGRLYLLRHYTFEKHGISMNSNTHLSLRDVTIFSFPGIGFIAAGDQHHLELLHCRITHPQNEHRPITTTADGFHVEQSLGFIKLEDCDFGYMGDDCINIHDNIHMGIRLVDAHTLVAEKIVTWSCPFATGDLVEIRNGDFSPTGFQGKLTDAKPNFKDKETTLVFDRQLPSRIDSDAILFNHRYGSRNFIIRNCFFHENRARGILCNTAAGLIEGNRFFHNQYSALHLEADVDPRWSEGFGARNIIVRDNKFESLNPAGAAGGAVVYLRAIVNGSPTNYHLLENFLFENNVFQEMTGPAFDAASFNNLVIRNNSFINREKAPIALKRRGAIHAEHGSGLWVEGNTWMTQNGIASPDLSYDPDTTQKLGCHDNHLKN